MGDAETIVTDRLSQADSTSTVIIAVPTRMMKFMTGRWFAGGLGAYLVKGRGTEMYAHPRYGVQFSGDHRNGRDAIERGKLSGGGHRFSLSDFRGPELNQRCGKSVGMSERFRAFDRDTLYLLPPSVQDWLPESHLARFVVEVVSELDLGELERAYAGRGSKAYHPEMLLAMLFYGYATGVFSSRKQEQAT